MKKILRILGMIACAFVLVLSGTLLTACGGANPYSVKGVTLNGTSECIVVWGENATQENKETIWTDFGVSNDEELVEYWETTVGEMTKVCSFSFNENGTCDLINAEGQETYYYVQSEDLKTVEFYRNAEHTEDADGLQFKFIDGEFFASFASFPEYNLTGVYFMFTKA